MSCTGRTRQASLPGTRRSTLDSAVCGAARERRARKTNASGTTTGRGTVTANGLPPPYWRWKTAAGVELRQDLASKGNCSAVDADLAGRDYGNEITYDGAPDGARWLGLNRKSFLGAACVRQAQILRLLNDADALQEDLQRAAGTAGTDETAARALELLTAYRRERVGSTQARTKPLPVARDRVSLSRAALEQARRAQGEYLDRRHQVVRLERQVKSCEQEAATLRAAQAVEAASEAARRAGRAAELSALFPDGPPRRSSEDDRLAQQVAAALATWSARPEPRSPGGPSVEALERELAATTEPAEADAVGRGPRSVPPYPAVAPYLAAAGVAAGIALALDDLVVPGLLAGVLGLGYLVWWWLAKGRRVTPGPKIPVGEAVDRRRLLRQQIEHRREADRRYGEDIRRCEQAEGKVRVAALAAGVPDHGAEAQVSALADWQGRRREELSELDCRSAQWDDLQQVLAGRELADIQAEALRLREEAATLAEHVDPRALSAVRGASSDRLADAKRTAHTTRAASHTARGQLQQFAADLPSVADAEDEMAVATRELEHVQQLDRALATTIEFLERAEERVHRDIAPVLRATVLEWLSRVTGERYTDCKVNPESLEVDVRSGQGPWRRAGLLSHGTAEQIYLLLRLALTRHLVTPGEVCPLILDDVVAACDANRKHVVLEALHAVSTATQAILFTHEEDVREWGRERLSGPRDRLTELAGPGAA